MKATGIIRVCEDDCPFAREIWIGDERIFICGNDGSSACGRRGREHIIILQPVE